MSRYDRVERTVPWIIVTVFLAGAVLVAVGIIADSLALALAGTFVVVAAGLAGVILPRVGLSAPLSFNANFPEGGRASASQAPAGDDPQQTASRFRFRQIGHAEAEPHRSPGRSTAGSVAITAAAITAAITAATRKRGATVSTSSALVIGRTITCQDGARGELSALAFDATTRHLNAIVVGGDVEPARLVPFELVTLPRPDRTEVATEVASTSVACTSTSIEDLEPAEPAKVLDVSEDAGEWGLVSLVYEADAAPETYLRARERVMASDGAVGRVHGCRVDVGEYPGLLAGLLVDVGHVGEERLVDVPARAVTSMKGVVVLDMTGQTVRDLPAAAL